jgi:hypothetical protein
MMTMIIVTIIIIIIEVYCLRVFNDHFLAEPIYDIRIFYDFW